MPDYMPNTEADLVVWFNDHAAGVSTHGATVGLSAGDITQAATDATVVSSAVNNRALYESKTQEVTAWKNILLYADINTPMPSIPAGITILALPVGSLTACVARARQRAERIKSHPNYTLAIGEDCRIVAAVPPPIPPEDDVPPLDGKALTDFEVRLTFAMRGHDQIEIWSKRGDEVAWTLLTVDTNSPYIDGRDPLVANTPETRQYRARYRDSDTPADGWSDIITVTAQA